MDAYSVDARRADMIGAEGCREFARRYFRAAQAVRRRRGRHAAYRAGWLASAWFFRQRSRRAC